MSFSSRPIPKSATRGIIERVYRDGEARLVASLLACFTDDIGRCGIDRADFDISAENGMAIIKKGKGT
jgi:hypothetical protein